MRIKIISLISVLALSLSMGSHATVDTSAEFNADDAAQYAAVCGTGSSSLLCKIFGMLFKGKKPAEVKQHVDEALEGHPEDQPLSNSLNLDEEGANYAAVCGTGSSSFLCKIFGMLFKGKKPAEVKQHVDEALEGHPADQPLGND